LIKELVKIPSITESARESEPGLWIMERLSAIPYFKENPKNLQWIATPLEGSPETLHSLLVRIDSAKPTKRTVLMIGHYDVVDVSVYGDLSQYAFDPEELALRFEQSGDDVLYGRGSMDMKCGVAIEIGLIEEFAADREMFDVNIVAAFVGDEENASAGMRGVLPALAAMQKEGLDFLAAINTEPGEAGQSGVFGPMVFLGTLGKLMPSFYVKGCGAHVGNYYCGYSSALALSRLVTYAEGNPHLADPLHGVSQPSWTCLDMGIIREGYSVTIPDRAYAYFNCFTTNNTPAAVAAQMRHIAAYAMNQTSAQLTDSNRGLIAAGYDGGGFVPPESKVYTLEELTDIARRNYGEFFDKDLNSYIEKIGPGDMRKRGIKVVDRIADMSGEEGPFAVCFFLPPWLPVRTDLTDDPRDKAVVQAARNVETQLFEKYGMKMREIELFSGLCDLSYVGAKVSSEDIVSLEQNMPGWGSIYKIPLADMKSITMPVLNLGPSGNDPHKKTERLNLHYSLDILPSLLQSAIIEIADLVPQVSSDCQQYKRQA
jgi:arginine utilization protein RocB